MSIIPASSLSPSELASLGNNLIRPRSKDQRRHRQVQAVNRSLAIVREQVGRLYSRRLDTTEWSRIAVAG